MKYYSQYKQDKFIDILFNRKRNGTFLDIGAHDGILFSNTYHFENKRDWVGLCIEPVPEIFERLKQNRKCYLENCCILDEEKTLTFRQVIGNSEMLSGILEFMDENHQKRIEKSTKLNGGSYRDIKLESKNINTLLEKYGLYEIDYCSIDTEGAECQIVKSIDFDKVNIRSFTIENNNNDDTIREYLRGKGYQCVKGEGDDFFIKKGNIRFLLLLWFYKFSWKIKRRIR